MSSREFLFVLASTRTDGNSERLARRAAAHLPAGATAQWVRLTEQELPRFVDTRHTTGYGAPQGAARALRDATVAATDLVIVTPVYWYGLAWPAKHYLDHWSGWMRDPELAMRPAMKGHALWAVVVDSDDEGQGSAFPVIDELRRTAEYMEMQWRGVLLGHANRPGDIEAVPSAMTAADRFFAGDGELDDDALWAQFHDRSLASAAWTHVAHLRIAWLHLARYPFEEAHLRMRLGIIHLNAAHGLVETPTRGYHETLTRVWLALVQQARAVEVHADSAAFVAAQPISREAPLQHYSKDRLRSLAARTSFVAPDLAPLRW